MINYEIKSQLAKLLATEDLVVENRNVETAQFNVETRVLTLPMWKRASNVVYDMLVGHEVGHALYTPNDWSWEDRIPQQFVNVVEDARIEKLMKRRYPGLSKSFYRGYEELAEKDFFDLEGQNLNEMNLADKANLFFKIGNFVDIPFSEKEMEIITMIKGTETFADTVIVAEELLNYCNAEVSSELPQDISLPNPSTVGNSGEEANGEEEKSEERSESTEEFGELEDLSEGRGKPEIPQQKIEVETDKTFEEKTQELNGNLDHVSSLNYVEIPQVNLDEIVVSNQSIHEELSQHWADQSVEREYYDAFYEETRKLKPRNFSNADTDYQKHKKNSAKEVNYLVKEFECKKSADAYSRSFTSKTGTLDCTKLHTYKYNEDLFKKVNIIPDGKNHGLIFILDWSGSMGDCLVETIKQLYNLIWFCNKVNIPFDVYAFTNSFSKDDEYRTWVDTTLQGVKEYQFALNTNFNLMHFFTSDVNRKTLDEQMKSLYRVVYYHGRWADYSIPTSYSLSGTPLNDTIICLHELIPQFQKKNKVQKVNTIILTDGEANPLPYYKKNNYYDDNRMGTARVYEGDYIRNRKTGYTYRVEHEYWKFTEILLNNLKQTFPDVNTIGIRLAGNSDFKGFVRRYSGFMADEVYKKIRKDKYVNLKSTGYTSYFGMLSNALDNDTDFEVEEGASKAKIKSAFVKNLNAKSLNRKVLSQFVDIIS